MDIKQSKHTPAPWRIIDGDEIVSDGAKNSFWTNNVGDPAIVCKLGFDCYDSEQYRNFDNYKANARHIVHCVNCHDELLEALENLLGGYTGYKGGEYRRKAQKAITKAKGII